MTYAIQSQRRWPLWLALAVCLAWLLATVAVAVLGLPIAPTPGDWAGLAASLAPPLVLALIVASLLPGAGQPADVEALEGRISRAAETAGVLNNHLAAIDAALDSSAGRTEALAAAAANEASGLAATATRLEEAAARAGETSRAAEAAAGTLAQLLPDLARQADEVDATLQRAGASGGEQARAVEQMLTNVRARHAEAVVAADASIGQMTGLLAQIDEASKRNTTAIATRAYALDAAVDGVLERSASAVDDLQQKVTAHAAQLQDSIAASTQQLELFGSGGAIAIGQRIDLLLRAAGQLNQQFADQEALQNGLQARIDAQLAGIEHRFAAVRDAGAAAGDDMHTATLQQLDALGRNFAAAQQSGARVVDDMTVRIALVQDRLGELKHPLAESQSALTGLGTLSGEVRAAIDATEATLAARLAAAEQAIETLTGRARLAIDETGTTLAARLATAREALAVLSGEAHTLIGHTDALHAAIAGGATAVSDAAAGLVAERQQVVGLTGDLAGHFDAARAALADIRTGSDAATAHASTELIEVFLRVREMSDAAAGAMRKALADVVAEAEQALARAGSDAAEASFGAPVRLQVAAVEGAAQRTTEAAQAASERLARQMVTLLETVAGVEAKVGEIDTRFEVRARDTLAARSTKLIDALNASSIDVAKLLSIDIGDEAWGEYLQGDRSVFTRSVVRQLDREATRRIARLFKHDAEFRDEAGRYLDLFETLIKRVLDDPDGRDFAPTMLSSDIGKLYVAIARAIDRLPPGAK